MVWSNYFKLFIACSNISNGVLTKGLRTSIVALEETTEDLFTKFNSLNSTMANKINMANDPDLDNSCK